MTINMKENIQKIMGWCPNAALINRKGEIYMVSYEGKLIDKIKGIGFNGILGAVHLVFGVWLVITALSILAKPQIFPWWILDINILASGILLIVGLFSLLIFFNFLKSANVHRILAANPDINFQTLSDIGSSEVFEKRFYETSMAHKFNSDAELKYFEKIFENKDIIIYQIK